MRLQGQLPQQPLLRHYYEHHDEHYYHYDSHYHDLDKHNLDLDKHNLDLDLDEHNLDLDDDAYVPTESNRPLHRRHSVL
jgi:hypothetical protein